MVPEVAVTDVGTSVPQLLVSVEQVSPAVDREAQHVTYYVIVTEMSNVVWVVVPAVTVGEAEVGSVTEIESPYLSGPNLYTAPAGHRYYWCCATRPRRQ